MSEEIKDEVTEETQAETATEATEEAVEAPEEKEEKRTYEVSFDSLGLTKPLNKMTAKELRALCVAKIPAITGASGMGKDELVSKIKDIFGMNDEEGSVSPYKDQILSLKREIKDLRTQKAVVDDRRERDAIRRKINKLKKRTRRLANAI